MVSSGHRELDVVLGGGVALGGVLGLEDDSMSNIVDSLLLYSTAEGVSHKQHCLLLSCKSTDDVQQFIQRLPMNLNVDDYDNTNDVVANDNNNDNNDDKKVKGEELDDDDTNDTNEDDRYTKDDLKIAWQYKKYIDQNSKTSTTTSKVKYCCSYDLSKKLQRCIYDDRPVDTSSSLSSDVDTLPSLESILDDWMTRVKTFVDKIRASNSVGRIFMHSIFDLLWKHQCDQGQAGTIVVFLLKVKQLIRDMKVILVISWCLPTVSKAHSQLISILDTFLKVESFAGHKKTIPVEFKDYCGFLIIKKSQQIGLSVPCRPQGSRYGFKRNRRKLQIEPLNLPPETSRAFGSCGADPPKKDLTVVPVAAATPPILGYDKEDKASHPPPPIDTITSGGTTVTRPKLNFPKATSGAVSISRVIRPTDKSQLDF